MAAVWMYGPPPSIKALRGFFQMQRDEERWQEYMADMTWALVKAVKPKFGGKMYSAIVHKDRVQDSRTGQEIVDGVRKELLKRKAAREVKKRYEAI